MPELFFALRLRVACLTAPEFCSLCLFLFMRVPGVGTSLLYGLPSDVQNLTYPSVQLHSRQVLFRIFGATCECIARCWLRPQPLQLQILVFYFYESAADMHLLHSCRKPEALRSLAHDDHAVTLTLVHVTRRAVFRTDLTAVVRPSRVRMKIASSSS